MTWTRCAISAVILTSVLALTAGCSGSDESPADGSPSADPTPTSETTAAADAVALRSFPGFTSCQVHQGPYLIANPMRVDEAVTLGAAELLGATNATIGEASVVAEKRGGAADSITFHSSEPSADEAEGLGWADREDLDGAELTPGRYVVFVPIQVTQPTAHFDGVEVSWTAGDRSDSTSAEIVTDFKKAC